MSDGLKLLILSDTHGNIPLAERAIEIADHVDEIIHLGDHYDDALILEDIIGRQLIKVPGNCDYEPRVQREILLDFGGITFLITHGDRYSVKAGYDRIRRRAIETRSSAVLFGHTHIPLVDHTDDILLINPGCLTKHQVATAAKVSINDGVATVEIIPIPVD